MSSKISIIIPVYNVENYIEECLNSVINQTYTNLEIICVDDCGIDNSMLIVEAFAKKDSRIKIIYHNKNKGLSSARNTGLVNATGEYIYFIDSDDFIDLDYLSNMVEIIENNAIDVVINNNIITYFDKTSIKQFWYKEFAEGIFEILNENFFDIPVMSWCKLYKKSFLDNLNARFPDGLKYEDNYFDATTLIYLDKVFITKKYKYYYRQRSDSIIGGVQENVIKSFDMINIIENIYIFYQKHNLLNKFKINILNLNWHLTRYINKKEYYEKIRKLFLTIEKDNFINEKLYNNEEIKFFNNILKYDNLENFNNINFKKINKFKKLLINIICMFIFNKNKKRIFRNKILNY